MHYTFLGMAVAASYASAQAVVPVGQICTPNVSVCALGANCYATNSMLQPVCGNFQASCSNDQQCAFNKCNTAQGLCNGALLSTSSAASGTATSTVPSSASSAGSSSSSVPSAPAGSLALGALCNPFQTPSPCAGGAQCWASNAGLQAACGNFNAACSSDSQCAFNTCQGGLCRGFRASSLSSASASAPVISASASGNATASATVRPTGGQTPGAPTGSSGLPAFTGAASPMGSTEAGSLMVALFAAIAWLV